MASSLPAMRRDDVSDDIDVPAQSACLDAIAKPTHLPGSNAHVLCAGHRSGHHILARHRVSRRHLHRRVRAAEFPQHFPASGWVEHEPEDIWTSTIATCREALKKGRRHRARTSPRSASPTSARPPWCGTAPPAQPCTAPSSGRTAAPPISARRLKSRRPRAGDLGQDRPDHRSLFFRHQSRLDPRPRPRRARTRRAGRADVRHRRLLSAVAADRRQGARHRRHQRLAHAAVQHPHRASGTTSC